MPENDVLETNRQLACDIHEEAKRNPQSPHAGKFVGIAHGKVVVVAATLGEMARRLEAIEPDPTKTLCLEAGVDSEAVEEIWRAA